MTEIMFCDFCIKADMDSDGNAFVKGCSTMKLYSIKKHDGSNNHLFAAKKSFAETDGLSLQKLQQFETCELPTVGATTRTVYKLTAGRGLFDMERIKIVDSLISALGVRLKIQVQM